MVKHQPQKDPIMLNRRELLNLLPASSVVWLGGIIEAAQAAATPPQDAGPLLGRRGSPGRRVFYRVAAQPLSYPSAYKLLRGEPVVGPVQSVTLPDPAAPRVRVAVVNDTHEHLKTVDALAARIEAVEPDVVVWNGDTCASAPFKAVFCHIPLRGLPKQNDGLSLEGYASWSGDGARAWMPVLREARVPLVVSGHTHAWPVNEPDEGNPMQVVGGGPDLHNATMIALEADAKTLRVAIQDLSGTVLADRRLT
jgi:hypothetical protein